VLFKLLADPTQETLESIKRDFVDNSATAAGCPRLSWALSLDDPCTIIFTFDWDRIQYHWDFWQLPEFEPVMACINKWFEPGMPLVRHYLFDPPGMLDSQYVRVFVWEHSSEVDRDVLVQQVSNKENKSRHVRAGFAIDPGQPKWCCVLLGYDSEDEARATTFTAKMETHLVKPEFVD